MDKLAGTRLFFSNKSTFSHSDIDTDKNFEAFKGILFTAKTALFDNTLEMNQLLYDKLSIGDIENALGEYINVFIVGSLKKAS